MCIIKLIGNEGKRFTIVILCPAQALKQPGPPRPKKEVPEVTQYKLPGYQTPVIKHAKPHRLTTKKPYAPKKENSGPPVPKSSYQPPGYKEAEKKKKEEKNKNKKPSGPPAGAASFKTQSGMQFYRTLFRSDIIEKRKLFIKYLHIFISATNMVL